jgi:hypothetical protein
MFTSFLWGLGTGLLLLLGIKLFELVTNYIKNNGIDVWVNLLFLMILLSFITSCSKEDVKLDLCGDCVVKFDVPFQQDENGYYRAKLLYNDAGAARFNIDSYASTIDDKSLWENDTPNFYSIFSGNIEIMEGVGMVQHSRLQYSKEGFTRRVVGPVLNEYIGDTLIVEVDTHWVYPPLWENRKNTLKFIIE